MTIVLNTLETALPTEQIESLLAGTDQQVKIIHTAGMRINHCIGCNQCWLRTPGQCAINDDYKQIIKQLVNAQNLWLVTDTKFGFLDYRGKRVMDRIMTMLNWHGTLSLAHSSAICSRSEADSQQKIRAVCYKLGMLQTA